MYSIELRSFSSEIEGHGSYQVPAVHFPQSPWRIPKLDWPCKQLPHRKLARILARKDPVVEAQVKLTEISLLQSQDLGHIGGSRCVCHGNELFFHGLRRKSAKKNGLQCFADNALLTTLLNNLNRFHDLLHRRRNNCVNDLLLMPLIGTCKRDLLDTLNILLTSVFEIMTLLIR